jgi:hypothetical protein
MSIDDDDDEEKGKGISSILSRLNAFFPDNIKLKLR